MGQSREFSGNISLFGFSQVLVAFSGGLDSTVLLHAVAGLRRQQSIDVRAVHIHHGISRYADQWAEHCQSVCQTLDIPLVVRKVTLNPQGQGTEASARQARYAVFAEILQREEALLTAHHQDDQCETLLLALKRGSGPAGLASMPAVLPFSGGAIVRPLLTFSRQQLTTYAEYHQLQWVDDDSNSDPAYDRNFLRLNILPLLEQRWPHFPAAAARSAELCGEQETLLDELLQDELRQLITLQKSLPISPLIEMTALKRAAILRRWLAHCGASMPSRNQLAQLWQNVACSREDANPCLVAGNGEIRRYNNQLWWVRPVPDLRNTQLEWANRNQPLTLPDNLGQLVSASSGVRIRKPAVNEHLSVRFTATGRLHIMGRERGRELKKIWQECQIPPWQRGNIPILFYNDEPVCAPGIFVCKQAQPAELREQKCWYLQWRQGELNVGVRNEEGS
ncbi:tRNA(Ile)-lysidine ligase [Tatumella morbirosei]|uniref:tRNA(Ile)-lysidine synthase n=1 Tax=Tatumella morbirosei TaxID=642227 RepID=A0A095T150_9GAMM|nr:tRNA lysidine(34) synthetase TilS [Tatumella morbirosei]KGD70477.1 tRNA(Ile)-lysidine ligase [Tatumella morbirosei]